MGHCKKDVTPLLTHWSYIFQDWFDFNPCHCKVNVISCYIGPCYTYHYTQYEHGTYIKVAWVKSLKCGHINFTEKVINDKKNHVDGSVQKKT